MLNHITWGLPTFFRDVEELYQAECGKNAVLRPAAKDGEK